MARPRASVNTNVSTVTDGLTGEVLAQTVTQEVISQGIPDSEPDFIKLYLNRIAKIQGLNNSQSSVLFEIAKQMPWASETDQYIILNSFAKDKIAQRLGVKQQYIKDTISKLAKEGMLIREGSARSAAYRINPLYIAKGNWADIKKLQLKVTFDAQHGEVIEGVEVEKMDGTIETIEAAKKEAAATKPPKKAAEPTPEKLEAEGQTSIFDEQAATTTEPDPEKKKECCHLCGAEKTEMKKHDGTVFLGCPNWREHKKGA